MFTTSDARRGLLPEREEHLGPQVQHQAITIAVTIAITTAITIATTIAITIAIAIAITIAITLTITIAITLGLKFSIRPAAIRMRNFTRLAETRLARNSLNYLNIALITFNTYLHTLKYNVCSGHLSYFNVIQVQHRASGDAQFHGRAVRKGG